MKAKLAESLKSVVKLSEEMLALAESGSAAAGGVECSIIFGTLRDTGYKLKAEATKELNAAGESPAETAATAAAQSDASVPEQLAAPATGQKKKVLIVDDEPDVVTYLKAWFEDRGFTTVTASDGAEALAALENEQLDLITLDMSMPEKSGVKAYREIKESSKLKDIPVIIITGLGKPMERFLDRTRQVPSPEGFVAKPIELTELAQLVNKLVA